MKFLILSRLPEIHSTRRLVQEIQGRNREVFVEHPDVDYGTLTGDLLIPRLGSYRYEESITKLQAFAAGHPEVRILNPPGAFHRARHKLLALQELRDLPQPTLLDPAAEPAPAHFPVVVKDCLSGQGEGVFLCRDLAELAACRRLLAGREILLQEFIAESAGHDVRAFVIGDRVASSMERISADPVREFRSNLSLGGRGRTTLLSEEEWNLCLSATRRLGLDYAGVDFVRSRRGPLLLEVNPCPGFEGIEKCSGLNLAKELVLYAESLLGPHPR
jgi:ribosomal protein S6--L-glutamate ligase